MSAFEELRDALDDAIRRAYGEPILPPVEGEDQSAIRSMRHAAVITNPNVMRHLAGIQAAAWGAVEQRIEAGGGDD